MSNELRAKQKGISIDWVTVILVLGLFAFGLITLANVLAEPFTGLEKGFSEISANFRMEFIQKQFVNFLIGAAAMLVMVVIDYTLYKQVIKYVYWANIFLLVLLLFLQDSSRGVFGWFNFGVRAFQPSETCKISITVMLAYIAENVVEKNGGVRNIKDLSLIVLYFLIPFVLVIRQPDFGTAVVFIAILIFILFISKVRWKYIVSAILFMVIVAPLSYFYLFSDTQRERIDMFLNPQDASELGARLHVDLSKEAIGSGQVYGKGYFTRGTLAQLKYVPERHTDFVFSGIGEGFGFVGGTILIIVYFLLIFRWLWVGLQAKDHFGACLAVGCCGMLLAHVFENIGMTIGLMPVTGIPLPFISYGGSNLLTNMIAVGIVLNVWMRRQVRR